MNLLQYLQRKYQKERPTAITFQEANAFGIKWPLSKGWLEKHGSIEITDFMRERLKERMQKKANKVSKKTKTSQYHQIAVNILSQSGPVTITVVSKQQKQRVAKKPTPTTHHAPAIDANSPGFLESYQWRAVRMAALVRYGAVCMCCGATSADGVVINVDHIKPRKVRPDLALEINNLQILCNVCNHGKGNWDQTDWRPDNSQQFDPLEQAKEYLKSF